jgi:CDP-diglyceride synthetase
MTEIEVLKPLSGRREWIVRSLSGIAIVLVIVACTIPEKLGLHFLEEWRLLLWVTLNAFVAGYGSYEYKAMALGTPRKLSSGLWRFGLFWAVYVTLMLFEHFNRSVVVGIGALAILYWVPPIHIFLTNKKRDVLSLSILWFFIPCFMAIGLAQEGVVEPVMFPALFVFLSMWTTDTFAFIFGKLFGRTKMAPAISPGKTWEGTLGGLLAASLMGWLIQPFAETQNFRMSTLAIAPVLGGAGVIGDLLQSFAKRRFGVKDSGTLIPGHGGVFDRFDSYLIAAPLLALLLAVRWFFVEGLTF